MVAVLCFGNLQCDVLCRGVTALPAPGELQPIEGIDCALSGNGGNVAAALGRLGLDVALAGYSGADAIGESFRRDLEALGVDLARLARHPSAPTGTSVIVLTPRGERGVLYVNGANALFDLDGVPDDWLRGVRVVALGSVFVLPQYSGAAVARLFHRARRHGAVTLLNPSWDAAGLGLPFLAPALTETDYLVLNHAEGRRLSGLEEPPAILAHLETYTRGGVALTLGEQGCLVRGAAGVQRVPAIPVQATDSTGAGDSFVAGFIAGLVAGHAPEQCAQLGCRVAAYAVTGPGAYPRIPRLADLAPCLQPRATTTGVYHTPRPPTTDY